MKYIFIFLFIGFSLEASELKPFYTDYCTFFPEGTPQRPGLWQHCCHDHDLRYWFGGTEKEQLLTDQRLKTCVSEVAGNAIANLMYYSVRTGHNSPIKHKTHWGWGWREKRKFYQALTFEEKDYLIDELYALDLEEEFLLEFITFYQLNKN